MFTLTRVEVSTPLGAGANCVILAAPAFFVVVVSWLSIGSMIDHFYLIADTSSGRFYVGKADGASGFLGRWTEYAKTGHGGNVSMRELNETNLNHQMHLQFSILQVFSPNAPAVR